MNILLDTNIIVNIVRADNARGVAQLINPDNALLYVSIVSVGELRSLSIKNKWGSSKRNLLEDFLRTTNIVDVDKSFINTYSEIDSYSQRLNPGFESYSFDTPRNMGKNDLWIASLAALLSLKLVTTDADFDHLHNVFFEVKKLNPADFYEFL